MVNFGLIFLFSLFFQKNSNLVIGSEEYIKELAQFLNTNQLIMVLLSCILFIPFFYFKIRKQKKLFTNQGIHDIWYFIWIIVSFVVIWNILLYDFKFLLLPQIPSWNSILATCFLGPILEELLFRGIIYHNLQDSFSKKKLLVVISILFALYHLNFLQGIYAFFFSLLVTNIYQKYSNLSIPIIMHCIANLIVSVFIPIVLSNNFIIIQCIFLLFITILIFSYRLYVKQKN